MCLRAHTIWTKDMVSDNLESVNVGTPVPYAHVAGIQSDSSISFYQSNAQRW